MTDAAPLFTEADLVYRYTRTQAIEDGVLVDISTAARCVGIRFPVAVTASVWAMIEEDGPEHVARRLTTFVGGIRLGIDLSPAGADRFPLRWAWVEGGKETDLYVVCGPGDDAEPVITVLMEGED